MSLMPESDRISSSRATVFFVSASTAPRRRSMAATSRSGRVSHARRLRAPMAVFVLSSTQRRLPRFSLARMVSVSSRLRRAERSSSMKRPCS